MIRESDGEDETQGILESAEEPEAEDARLESIFDEDEDAPLVLSDERAVELAPAHNDGVPPLDSGLTDEQRQEFIKLLNEAMPVAERAKQLALLAKLKGQKTAAVGLRAIIEINELTGMRDKVVGDATPMFQMPEGSNVHVHVRKVEK